MSLDWRTELDEACGPLPVHQLDAGVVLLEKACSAALLEAAQRVRNFASMSVESVSWHLERMAQDWRLGK
jgi:hypothetical protein